MPRPAKGTIMERPATNSRINRTLRFHALGRRRTVPLGVVSREEAERQLAYVMADVARGTWRPAEPAPDVEVVELPTFHEFAEEWWVRNERQFAESTKAEYRWRLESHLLPYFKDYRLHAITFDLVERYIAGKLAEDRPLSPRSINMTVTLLGAIFEGAVERELVPRNPARGKGRKVRERAPRRSFLETARQVEALLGAAGELDRKAHLACRHVERRAMLATLTFAGPRIGELCALRWRDVDLAAGWLHVEDSKTDAGRRRVKIRGALRDELMTVSARRSVEQGGYVFPTASGARMSADNFRSRVLRAAVKRANSNLEGKGLSPLPEGLTPHSLRRTFASVLYALGEPPPVVMAEMGHTDAALTLKVYAQAMRLTGREKAQLRALIEGRGSGT